MTVRTHSGVLLLFRPSSKHHFPSQIGDIIVHQPIHHILGAPWALFFLRTKKIVDGAYFGHVGYLSVFCLDDDSFLIRTIHLWDSNQMGTHRRRNQSLKRVMTTTR